MTRSIMMLHAENLSRASGITHGFFTRNGGVSTDIYRSLNCGIATHDNPHHVAENLSIVAHHMGTSDDHVMTLKQVHGNDVITVTDVWDKAQRPQADALVTHLPGIALGILTADCIPLLFADAHHHIIGAAHAGWRGTLAGVINNCVQAMVALGAQRNHIMAAIGPSIAQASYEVDAAFRATWLSSDASYHHYFIPATKPAHYLFDLKRVAYDMLKNAGIGIIDMLKQDTYQEEETFFSYRRATHRRETDYGRQISAIMIQ